MTAEKLKQAIKKERITRALLVVGFVSIFCGMNTLDKVCDMNTLDKGGILVGVIFAFVGIVAILCATKILRGLE